MSRESIAVTLPSSGETSPVGPATALELCALDGLAATVGTAGQEEVSPALDWSDIECSAEGPGDCITQRCRDQNRCTYGEYFQRLLDGHIMYSDGAPDAER